MRQTLLDLKRTRSEQVVDSRTGMSGRSEADLLGLLVRGQEAFVTTDDLMLELFPDTGANESRRRLHLATLRRTLQDGGECVDVVAASGRRPRQAARGRSEGSALQRDGHAVAEPRGRTFLTGAIPEPNLPLIGRARDTEAASRGMLYGQCVTVTGAEGVGKTRLALEIAQNSAFADGVCWVSLEATNMPQAMLDVVGLQLCGDLSAGRGVFVQLKAQLADKEMLVILDGVDGAPLTAAELAEALLDAGDGIRVLATARRPLKTRREMVVQLAPLDVPAREASHGEILSSAAVRLFVAATRSAGSRFAAEEQNLAAVATLCRELGGIPLAIELAAVHGDPMDGLVRFAETHQQPLSAGANDDTPTPCRGELAAIIDLSVRALNDPARIALRWLAIFDASFSADGACDVLAAVGLDRPCAAKALADLVARSLVIRESPAQAPRYRLRNAVRRCALEMLDASAERPAATHAHASYLCMHFDRMRSHWRDTPIVEWLLDFQRELAAFRSASAWARSISGDATLAVKLAVVATPYLFDLSLVDECRTCASDALNILESGAHTLEEACQEKLQLLAAHGASIVYTHGPGPDARAAWLDVLALARKTGNREFELRALWGLWIIHRYAGEVRESLACAKEFSELCGEASTVPQKLIAARMEGISLHYAGRQAEARTILEPMIGADANEHLRWNIVGQQIEWRVGSLATLARICWLQGDGAKALELAEDALRAALQHQNAISVCYVLAESLVPMALLSRQFEAAQCALTTLSEMASRFGFSFWLVCSKAYTEFLGLVREGDARAISSAQTTFNQLRGVGNMAGFLTLAGQLAHSLMDAGRHAEALAIVQEALKRAEANGEHWYTAELLRIKGELCAAANHKVDAACLFSIAQDRAGLQTSHAFSRRAALSLATLWHEQGRTEAAIRSLEPFCI
ncbi:hypothetical protein AYM40_29580 [Paraburkholderia phytofirmans OLGA172]|uniref:NB-ARC domain-containing protein n=1 Tax=Paraburkholderia phytofirmans OLGA172 TaxID=1417228 RepID=A0A161HZT7_9BURK|nr:hypothetical protein AYM40_29580 [Paraburkholderia phytofirmans OLGA172]